MAVGGLYQTKDYASTAMQAQQGVAQTTAGMSTGPGKAKKTAMGAASAAAGGAIAGAAFGGVGAVVGGVAGLAMYYM
jgi:hypothetical protein